MKVILLCDVKKVGVRGAVIEVADGFAQNVLIPKKQAVPAIGANLKKVQAAESARVGKAIFDASMARKALAEVDGKSISIQSKANAQGGLFEAIRVPQVAEAIQKELGIAIPEDAIQLVPEHIKTLGEFRAEIELHGASAEIAVVVSAL
ncbi:MAG: 50S ribosomal protein L9 [Patescibacteria group bacterium]|nr:50S ribosomal protein L9 [Patescibacteria group bacterium]